jgi:poly(A) polymerase
LSAFAGREIYHQMKEYLTHPVFKKVAEAAAESGTEAYVVGGFVRDIIMGRTSQDIDIVTIGSGIDLAEKVAYKVNPGIKVATFKRFGTAMFCYGGFDIEFVGARKESYSPDSRKPAVEDGCLDDDQKRRDFTINAMAISLSADSYGMLIDPFGGLSDIKSSILKTPLDPETTFSDDPLRMMRAVRFACQLGFQIDKHSFEAISKRSSRIGIVSGERIAAELNKIVLSPRAAEGFMLLDKCGLLQHIFPEMQNLKGVEFVNGKGHKDNFLHTLKVLSNLSAKSEDLWLRWAALLHDIAKPATKKYIEGQGWTFHGHEFLGAKMVPQIFKALRLPLDERMKYVQKLVLLHLRPIVLSQEEVTDSAIRRLLFDAADDIEDLMLLAEADITSKDSSKVKRYLANFSLVRQKLKEVEEKDAIRNWQPPVSGEEIMEAFGIKPCKEVGEIKNAIRNAILDGEIRNDEAEAKQFMIKAGLSLGLTLITGK